MRRRIGPGRGTGDPRRHCRQTWVTIPPLVFGVILMAFGIATIVALLSLIPSWFPVIPEQEMAGGPSSIRLNIQDDVGMEDGHSFMGQILSIMAGMGP